MSARTGLLLVFMGLVTEGRGCEPLVQIRQFIGNAWSTLRRSDASVLEAATDSKIAPSGRVVIYAPHDMPVEPIRDQLRGQLTAAEFAKIAVLSLPEKGEPSEPGLLYLPHPYVVPGGRFNEMYGWDSYFILLGLLQDNQVQLAKDMTDNLVFEVEHYGKVLNANRSYYLSRSQPPFLSEMVLEVYQRTKDTEWLKGTLPALGKYYAYWTQEPHLTPKTGLSRYEGGADTPSPEVIASEKDISGRNDYDRIRWYFKKHHVSRYDVSRFYNHDLNQLTPLFYRADRAMRESGFDPSSRFGPFSAAILDYNPVDLNSLLYRTERDISGIYADLQQPEQAGLWADRAKRRAEQIERLMWDEKQGLYFDYNFVENRRSNYRFLTTFYPLWLGIASAAQAARVAENLPIFERAGGLQTSAQASGDQWDAPFGWAPLQLIAVEGLRRYGFQDAADRVSVKFMSMVLEDFEKHGTIREKYDVVGRRSDLTAGLKFGYSSNEIGFGWTNAVFLQLYEELTPAARDRFESRCRE
jgi:alpha,alpha-trehalase